MTLPQLADAMETPATDLRGDAVLPYMLRRSASRATRALRDGARPSCAPGARPAPTARTPTATACTTTPRRSRIMDAWWPLLVRGAFEPRSARTPTTLHRPSRTASTTTRTTTAPTSARPTRAAPTPRCRRTCARCSAASGKVEGAATRATTAAARSADAAPAPLPRAAALHAGRGDPGRQATARALRGRHLQDPARPRPARPAPQGRRPVVLRRDLCARSPPRSSSR